MRFADFASALRWFVVAVLLASAAQPARSQEHPCTTRQVAVSFRDEHNLPLQGISTADLEAKVHGKPIKIVSVIADSRPHRLVLVLDTSGSMGSIEGEPPLWALGMSLARHFFEVNRDKAQLAFLLFNNSVTDQVDFAQGNSAVGEKLRQLEENHNFLKTHIKGRTALRDAIFHAILMLDHPTSADAVYVLTDGGDNASHNSAEELERRLAVTSVRIFAVLLYKDLPYRNRTPEEEMGPQDLAAIAHKSGGDILTAAEWRGNRVALSANPDAKVKSEEMLNRLYQTILKDTILEIELPSAISSNAHWELTLSSDARRRWKGTRIIYPDTLVGCNAEVFGGNRN